MSPRALVVVPCYNEAKRLDTAAMLRLARETSTGHASVLMVNDGSTDDTMTVLKKLAADSEGRIDVMDLPRNGGKAEAVRQGLQHASRAGAEIVGFADADLATPVHELVRLLEILSGAPELQVVMGSRVAMAGRHVIRKRTRHYLGRIFATFASTILQETIYDTQCGAKFFRVGPPLEHALAEPFYSRWAFDVELLGRLLIGSPDVAGLDPRSLLEVPLYEWVDVGGSKVKFTDMARSALDMMAIASAFERRRRAVRRGQG